jgi:hypothetical protein
MVAHQARGARSTSILTEHRLTLDTAQHLLCIGNKHLDEGMIHAE